VCSTVNRKLSAGAASKDGPTVEAEGNGEFSDAGAAGDAFSGPGGMGFAGTGESNATESGEDGPIAVGTGASDAFGVAIGSASPLNWIKATTMSARTPKPSQFRMDLPDRFAL
jgi:hypothetical protein